MKFRTLAAAAAALTMTATPVFAQANSVELQRDAAPVEGENDLAGGSSILLILALIAIATAIYLLIDNDDDTPVSS